MKFEIPVKTVSESTKCKSEIKTKEQAEEMYREYLKLRSVHKVGVTFGCCGETVRNKFIKFGLRVLESKWREQDDVKIINYYKDTPRHEFSIKFLAAKLQRSYSSVALRASRLGLGDFSRPKARSKKQKQPDLFRKWNRYPHPRGMKGKYHTEENKKKQSDFSKKMWADPNSKLNSQEMKQFRSNQMLKRIVSGQMRLGYTRCRGGRRPDLDNMYFRSAWEANYARYLNFLKSKNEISCWEFESKTFVFEKISRGTRAYTPDFKVTFPDGKYQWHEVKGWMDQKSRTRLSRMKIYYPDEVIVVVGADWFRRAVKSGLTGIIKGWEGATVH